jgi:hypothetical protein
MSVQILATIQNLEAQLALLKGMVQETQKKEKKVKNPDAPKKQPSEGVLRWNALIAETLEKMKASDWVHPETGKPATRKDAMAAASANKKAMSVEGSPSRVASEENHGKANSVAEESGTESDKGKKGPKKGSHWSAETKAAAAAKRAAKKMSNTPPLPSSPKVEDE